MERLTRRSFLGWTAVGAAAILTPSIVRPRPRVFVFGAGRAEPIPLTLHGYRVHFSDGGAGGIFTPACVALEEFGRTQVTYMPRKTGRVVLSYELRMNAPPVGVFSRGDRG
jgi:hypothetical protein